MTWALWLAVPVVITVSAALVTWVRSRPEAPAPAPATPMRAHSDYLDALVQTARSKDRGPYAPPPE